MSAIDAFGKWLRDRVPFIRRIEEWVWSSPPLVSGILSALGHGLVTALAGPFAPIVAVMYTESEIRKAKTHVTPLWDAVLDVVVPWCVVIVYVSLFWRWYW